MSNLDQQQEPQTEVATTAEPQVAAAGGAATVAPVSMMSNVSPVALRRRIMRRKDGGGEIAQGDEAMGMVQRAAEGSGQPVDAGIRGQVEQATGANLDGVRVHTGSASAQAAEALSARAYTVGQDVHFASGQYQPGSTEGNHLIAHELVHTVQQGGAPVATQTKLEVSDPGDSAEVEADRIADAVVSGSGGAAAPTQVQNSVGRQVVQRDPTTTTATTTAPTGGTTAPTTAPTGGYDKQALFQAVVANNAGEAVRIAALNPTQAMTDLAAGSAASENWSAGNYLSAIGNAIASVFGGGDLKQPFFRLVREGKPYSSGTRARLGTIYHAVTLADKKKVFEAQFSVSLQGQALTGGGNAEFTASELDALYDQCAVLPPAHVEGNPNFMRLVRTSGALAEGSYSSGQINMDSVRGTGGATELARYTQVMRHEVGHAVDDRLGGPVNDLRLNTAGWKKYASANEWITAMGGIGNIPTELQAAVRAAVQAYLGGGSQWGGPTATFEATLQAQVTAARPTTATTDMTTLQGLYGSNNVLKACIGSQGSTSHWNYANRPVIGDKAYFINHYYPGFYSVKDATHANLISWGNSAAAFSDKEWFAEVYSDWYGPGASRNFPGYVVDFFNNTVETMAAPSGARAPTPSTPSPTTGTGAPAPAAAPQAAGAPPQGASGYPKVPRGG